MYASTFNVLTELRNSLYKLQLQLILLSSRGEEIYVGPLGHQSSELIEYFEVSSQSLDKPLHINNICVRMEVHRINIF